MIAWLTDTLIMTGAIMALILLVRRPVGRWFGPGAAYALWALPMIRLFLPPLVLPETLAATRAADALLPPVEPAVKVLPVEVLMVEAAAEPTFAMPWGTILIAVWLGGAALFLAHRVIAYRVMRRQLMAEARVVGHAGAVRIVESPAVAAPVAFGVFDKVVALPQGFLATADSDASDFAITHELEHHAGKDLIANMAVQPLFALHWFNPVAWLAWRALRSDQEAACDARVMTGCTRRERERYGRLIASFAAGSKFALAAPMAGPLKGDKPIIHRLKALVRNEEAERHPLLGRSLFAASVIAVPLTATVTYAADEVAEPEAPPMVHAAPAVPAVPADAGPLLSMALARPEPLALSSRPADANKPSLITIKHGLDETCADAEETAHRQVVMRDGRRFQILTPHALSGDEIDRVVENALTRAERATLQAERAQADVERAERLAERNAERAELLAEQHAERAERLAERRAELEAGRAERLAEQQAERAERMAERSAAIAERTARMALASAPKVEQFVSSDGKVQTLRLVTRFTDGRPALTRTMVIDATCAAGQQTRPGGSNAITRICTGAPDTGRHIAVAFAQARASVASATMPAHLREEILAEFDRGIAHARAVAN